MVKVSVTPFNIVSSYLISNIFVVKSSNSLIHDSTFKYHQPSRNQVHNFWDNTVTRDDAS